MKIAFLSSLNPADKSNWSGTLYAIYHTLKQAHDVRWIGGEVLRKLQRVYEIQQGNRQKLFLEKYSEKIGDALAKEVRNDTYDLIVARDYSFIAYLDTDLPVVYIADTTFRQLNGYFKCTELFSLYAENVEQRAIDRSDLIVYSSEWAAQGAVEYYRAEPGKIKVIEFGANLPRKLLEHVKKPAFTGSCNLLFVGRSWKSKGGPKAYETYRLLRDSQFACTLTIIGCEPEPAVPSDPGIEIHPYLDKSKEEELNRLKACYEKAGFFILPTEFDCFGIVFSEASAFGVPSVAADAGGVSQAVKEGANGYLLPADATAADYANVIRTVYADKAAYTALCASARREYRRRLNWDVWLEKMNRALIEVVANYKNKTRMTDDLYIPTYIINLKKREDRKTHVLNEFKGKEEFQLNLVEACEHPIGNVGLWQSIGKVVAEAVETDHDVILICEDDHCFTPDYSRKYLFGNILEVYRQGAEIVSGGIGGFGTAVPVAANRYWVDWFWCTQFIVVYRELYQRILNYEFKDTDTVDGVLSQLADKKIVLYPFVSRQTTFGYSDITQSNQENPELILTHFHTADRRMKLIHSVSKYYNFPW